MNSEHVHGDVFSGVFYLKAPEESGKLVLQNPAINRMWNGCALTSQKNQFTGESIRIEPVEGNIILFPSYLPTSKTLVIFILFFYYKYLRFTI
jgi:uncharacterized protein (TIGR02466 family)